MAYEIPVLPNLNVPKLEEIITSLIAFPPTTATLYLILIVCPKTLNDLISNVLSAEILNPNLLKFSGVGSTSNSSTLSSIFSLSIYDWIKSPLFTNVNFSDNFCTNSLKSFWSESTLVEIIFEIILKLKSLNANISSPSSGFDCKYILEFELTSVNWSFSNERVIFFEYTLP